MALHKVAYRGLSDIRSMSKKELADAGVGMEGDLVWDKTKDGPRPVVFVENVSDRLLEIFKEEGTFTVTEVNDRGQEVGDAPVIQGAALDDTGKVVKDGRTGEVSEKKGAQGRGGSTGTSGTTTTGGSTL